MSLRIGIAGLGRGSSFAGLINSRPDSHLACVCDVNPDRARGFAEAQPDCGWYSDLDEFLAADLDAVIIATPAPVHGEHCVRALRAGKHVMGEVPAVWTVEEGQTLARAVEETGLKYFFAENMNYMAFVQSYDRLVKDGRIGEPYYAEAEYIHDCRSLMVGRDDGITPGSATGRTWRASMPPIHYCTHSLGPLLQIMDDRVVTAVGMHTGPRLGRETDTIDMEVALFHTAKGNVIKVTCGFVVAREPSFHYLSIYGTEGVLESPRGGYEEAGHKANLAGFDNLQGMATLPLSWSHTHMPPEAHAGGHGTSEYLMVNDFVRCVLDDTPPAIDVYFGMDMTLPGICAHQSAQNGSVPVAVPDLRATT